MNNNKYYDGTKLLSLTDINGNKPELILCTSNRSAGKTTYFGRMFMNRFLKHGEKFALLYRFKYELDNVSDKFYKELKTLFFPDYEMSDETRNKGIYHELFLTENGKEPVSCGYAIAINSADQIKKISHLLSDVKRMLFDEFQSESNTYCPDEVTKFISIHTSIARGGGEQVRFLPVYMLSNQVSIINPYYTKLGISSRLNKNVNFMKGDGFVLENGFVENASRLQKESAFNRAFKGEKYVAYSSENIYLNDNNAFIENPWGKMSRYVVTIKYLGREYGIKEYKENGYLYCDLTPDSTFPHKIAVTTDDHDINYVMLHSNKFLIDYLRKMFEHGAFRFKNLNCKEAIMKCISY